MIHKRKVVFRADGSSQIGLGHFIRSLALAEMLKDDFYCVFVSQAPNSFQIDEINEVCPERIDIPNDEDHFNFFLNLLKGDEIVVLDNYYFTTEYQIKIKSKGCKLVCIDDLFDKNFVADLIINHAPSVSPSHYKAEPYTQYAIGLEYALLRSVFLAQARKKRVVKNIDTLLICFGGSDQKNYTLKTLRVAIQFEQIKKIIVIVGNYYSITKSFTNIVEGDSRIEVRKNLRGFQMLGSMLETHLAIVPSSGILLEAISAGCIAITGITVENQKFIHSNFINFSNVFDASIFSSSSIKNSITSALNYNKKTPLLIDGNSNTRIVKLFLQLATESTLSIRDAKLRDLDTTYKWASNPVVRAFSFQRSVISLPEHTNWFINKLADSSCYYFIIENKNNPVGSIRFDVEGDEAVISFLLDPIYHGQGIGTIILKKGIERIINIRSKSKKINALVGYVMAENIPSIRIFESFNFIKHQQDNKIKFIKWLQ